MQRRNLQTTSLVGLLLGMAVLYSYAANIEPSKTLISDLEDHVGKYVIATGTVLEIFTHGTGNNGVMLISDDNATVRIYFDQLNEDIQVSDVVEVMGLVSRDNDGISITVSMASSVSVVEHWDTRIITLPSLAARPWDYTDMNTNISCVIGIPLTDEEGYAYFLVEDRELPDYSMFITVFGLPVQRSFVGEMVNVCVRIEYDQERLSFSGVMDSKEHHIWSSE